MKLLIEQHKTKEECLNKIYREHGENITIMQERSIFRGGVFGHFQRPGYEIRFMVNKPLDTSSSQPPLHKSTQAHTSPPSLPHDYAEERLKILQHVASSAPNLAPTLKPIIENTGPHGTAASDTTMQAVENLSKIVERLSKQIETMQTAEPQEHEQEHEAITEIRNMLENNEFTPSYRTALLTRMKSELTLEQLNDKEVLNRTIAQWIAQSISIRGKPPQAKPRIIVIVGPTGVGKTTTLVKLAAHYSLIRPKQTGISEKVRVLTTDDYRIGAIDQIKKYCNSMRVPFSVIQKPSDLRITLDLHKEDADVICMDTSGRSPYDEEKIAGMHAYFELLPANTEIYLAVSAGTKADDIREIMNRYKLFSYTAVIVTKFDETRCSGNLISILSEVGIPVAYITTGQIVPRDFESASAGRFLTKVHGLDLSDEYYLKNFG